MGAFATFHYIKNGNPFITVTVSDEIATVHYLDLARYMPFHR